MEKKKILMLGGSDTQVSAIKKAREMGYYVIICDYLPNNPGQKFADESYSVSTTDEEAVLNLARTLKVDAVLTYASDPAALPAAYVSERLNLPGNPYHAVEILSRKDVFREFMCKNGFFTPESKAVTDYNSALDFIKKLKRAAIIKPVDSSGSKGVFKIMPGEDFEERFKNALSFSNAKIVIVEEFIKKKGYQIGGDGFLSNGELIFRCFGDIHFSKTNPLPSLCSQYTKPAQPRGFTKGTPRSSAIAYRRRDEDGRAEFRYSGR